MPASLAASLSGDHEPLLAAFRSFVDDELAPLAREVCDPVDGDVADGVVSQVRARSAELGFYAGEYPEDLGGRGMAFTAKLLMHDHAEQSGCPLAPLALGNAEGPSELLLGGTAEQRKRYLEPLVRGVQTRCLALTEQHGGSNAFDMATVARRVGERWSLSGTKSFVSNAGRADFALVYAIAETSAGTRVPAVFLVDTSLPGVELGPRIEGLDGDGVFELALRDVDLGDDELLGGPDRLGDSASSGISSLSRGRLIVAAGCNGMAGRALELGRCFAQSRSAFGVPIGRHQHVQEHLVASRMAVESSRLLTVAAGLAFDAGQDVFEWAAMAKLSASEGAIDVVNRMFQVHGAAAWVRGHPLERLYRRVRVFTITEGTSEIQKVIIAHAMGLG